MLHIVTAVVDQIVCSTLFDLTALHLFEYSVAEKLTRRPRTSGIFSAPYHLSNKIVSSPKISTNTYRMELILCQLNSVNVLLHIT